MCKFSIDFTGSAEDLVSKLSAEIKAKGGTFNGDASSGNFSVSTPLGKVAGSYSISGQSLSISISQKPALVSCRQIENYVRDFLR